MSLKKTILIGLACSIFLTACSQAEVQSSDKPESSEPVAQESSEAVSPAPAPAAPAPAANEPDIEKMTVEMNGHTYEYDTVSSATIEAPVDEDAILPEGQKASDMYWSGRPAVGFVKGDYYHSRTYYTKRTPQPYIAEIQVVKDGDNISMVEFNEWCVEDYSDEYWAGYSKRLSGYAQSQAENPRTDSTLMTWVNGATLVEYQMVTENRLSGDFKTIHGSSNSMRFGFMPLARGLSEQTGAPSGQYYYGLTKDLGQGMFARIAVVYEGDKIVSMKYDEYFDDTPENIADATMQQFSRQSKYYSRTFAEVTGNDFNAFMDTLEKSVVDSQDLQSVSADVEGMTGLSQELENYKALATELAAQM